MVKVFYRLDYSQVFSAGHTEAPFRCTECFTVITDYSTLYHLVLGRVLHLTYKVSRIYNPSLLNLV